MEKGVPWMRFRVCSSWMLFYPSESIRTIRDREPRTSTSTCTQLLRSESIFARVWCWFTSAETVGIIRNREPRTSTSTFTQLLSSEMECDTFGWRVALHIHRNHRCIKDGRPRRPSRLSHSSWALMYHDLVYVHRNRRFVRDGSQGRPPRLSHSSWALNPSWLSVALPPQKP